MKKLIPILIILIILLCSCTTTKKTATNERSEITNDFISILNENPELKDLTEKSLLKGAIVNPDKKTNPVQTLDELYDFLDWCSTCMPWEIISLSEDYPSIYDQIDQSLNYFYYILDQPLEELEGKGYYYPTLQYVPEIASWCKKYASSWGDFLSTEESWNDDYFKAVVNSGDFGFDEGWYGYENKWNSFNEFFARKLISQDVRPIADASLVSPAYSQPQGVWKIDDCGNII